MLNIEINVVGTFLKGFSQGRLPKVRLGLLRLRRLQWCRVLRLGWDRGTKRHCYNRQVGQALWLWQIWEVAAWEIVHLESCHIEKYPW